MFVHELFLLLGTEVQYEVISMVAKLVLNVFDGVIEIQAERDCSSNASEDIPVTQPHELTKMRGREFSSIVSIHID